MVRVRRPHGRRRPAGDNGSGADGILVGVGCAPSWPTVKTLFATSGNTCALDGCDQQLTDPAWQQVQADIAHIHGETPMAARHDPSMSPAERRAFENLMLLCPNCHRTIDSLRPDDFPVGRLVEMKQRHEERYEGTWASDELLDQFSLLLLISTFEEAEPPPSAAPPPRPEVQKRQARRYLYGQRKSD